MREGNELVEAHLAVAIQVHELGADRGQLEALTYERRRDPEPGGDVLRSPALAGQGLERLELVRRMPGHTHLVFGEADFFAVGVSTMLQAISESLSKAFCLTSKLRVV